MKQWWLKQEAPTSIGRGSSQNAGIVGSLMDCSPYRDFWEFIVESGEEKIADCLRTLRNN